MKTSRFGALLVVVLMGVTTWHCAGCASDAEASVVMQKNMKNISAFADDNDMNIVFQVSGNGKLGVSIDQFVGIDTGLNWNATLTARGDDGPSTVGEMLMERFPDAVFIDDDGEPLKKLEADENPPTDGSNAD